MYEPKFKKGDFIRPVKGSINYYPDYTDLIQINDIVKINKTFYYTIYNDFFPKENKITSPLVSAIDFDNGYELDKVYLRKHKLNKIIYNSYKS